MDSLPRQVQINTLHENLKLTISVQPDYMTSYPRYVGVAVKLFLAAG